MSGKDDTSRQGTYSTYESSTSFETITRMDTATASSAYGPGNSTATAATNICNNDTVGVSGEATDWRSAVGLRSGSIYSAPAAVNSQTPGETGSAVSAGESSECFNNPADIPSYTRPSYSRSESNESKKSDLDIIFGDDKSLSYGGNGKFKRSGGSISDADFIFGGGPSHYKSEIFSTSKSMSTTSDYASGNAGGNTSYKIYEGIQNEAFSDYNDSPLKNTPSNSGSIATHSGNTDYFGIRSNKSKEIEEEDDMDLK